MTSYPAMCLFEGTKSCGWRAPGSVRKHVWVEVRGASKGISPLGHGVDLLDESIAVLESERVVSILC